VAVLSSCRKLSINDESGAKAADARVDGASSKAALGPAAVDAGAFIPATHRACRVMALRGTAIATPRSAGRSAAAAAGRPLARGDLVPEGGLIELGADTELTVQATVSTREITLLGPARLEACPEGDESVRLSYGKVTALPGAGVRPGAEVWIATPLGVVRFSDAKLEIAVLDADARQLEIAVITSQASFVPAAGVVLATSFPDRHDAAAHGVRGSERGAAGSALVAGEAISLAPGTTVAARRRESAQTGWIGDLVAACVRQAGVAREAAQLMGARADAARGALGDLAFAHVKARQIARAACESAWAAEALAPGLDAAGRADLARADANWKAAAAPSSRP
jgi:hypothetical protein